MSYIIVNSATAPLGAVTEISATIGSITAISGFGHTTFGRYNMVAASSSVGGLLTSGTQVLVIIPVAINLAATSTVKFSPAVGTMNGVITGGSLHTIMTKKQVTFLVGNGITPAAITLPAGMIVTVMT